MLGHQAELAEQIQTAKNNLEKTKSEYEVQNKIVEENGKTECQQSPKYYIKKMRLALQGDSSWSGRDKLIKGNRQNTGIRDDTYKQFIGLTTTKTRDQLLIEFNETLKELRIAQQGDATILTKVPLLKLEYNEDNIVKLLRTKIEKPELSEREIYLLELVQNGKSLQLNNMLKVFLTQTFVHVLCVCSQFLKSIKKIWFKAFKKYLVRLWKNTSQSYTHS